MGTKSVTEGWSPAEAQQNDTSALKCDDRKCGWPGISMWSAQKQHFPNAETQNISQTQTRNVAAKFWLLSSSLLKCRFKPQSWMGWGFASTDIKLPSASLLGLWRTFTALRVMRLAPCMFPCHFIAAVMWFIRGHITVLQPEHLVQLPVISRAMCWRYCLCREMNCIHYTVGFPAVFLHR